MKRMRLLKQEELLRLEREKFKALEKDLAKEREEKQDACELNQSQGWHSS